MMRRRHHPSGDECPHPHDNASSHAINNSHNEHLANHMPKSYHYWRILLFLLVSLALTLTVIIARQPTEPYVDSSEARIQQVPVKGLHNNKVGITVSSDEEKRKGRVRKRKDRQEQHNEIRKDSLFEEAVKIHGTDKKKKKKKKNEELSKMRPISGSPFIFDQCFDPLKQSDKSNNQNASSLCTYFHPVLFFQEGQPGHAFREAVLDQDYPDLKLAAWSWQVNNWHHSSDTLLDGPPMELPKNFHQRQTVESVFGFATPKAASRTQWQLFLDHLSPPKKPIQKRRIGEVTAAHVKELYKRQTLDSKQQHGADGMKLRRDIVFAVMRDPVSRFLSSMTQVLSMRHTARCVGCNEYLEPCLLLDHASSREMFQCILGSVQQHGFWNEHLIPSAVFLTRPLVGIDVELAVFPIEHLDDMVVKGFGVREPIQLNERKTKAMDSDEKLQALAHDLLAGTSAANAKNVIIDDAMIAEICSLYAVDVAIMHHLKFPVKHCDDILRINDK